MNISKKIAATALTLAITVGGTTAAFATDGPDPTGGREAVIAKVCEHKDEILTKLSTAETKINERIVKVTERSQKATAAGHDKAASRMEKRISRLNKLLIRVTDRAAKAPAWIAENCS